MGGPGIICARPDDLPIPALFDDVRRPSGSPGDDEQRGEHPHRNSHEVVGDRAVPIEVGKHFLFAPEGRFDAVGDREQRQVARFAAQGAGHFLDDRIARIGHGVDRMAKADDDFLPREAARISASAASGLA